MASNIQSNNNPTVNRFLGNRNDKSLFFSYICEEEVLRRFVLCRLRYVVDHLSNETSTDCNNISMVLIKNALNQLLGHSHISGINLLNLASFLIA